jgi:putative oxidoreductase
MRWFAAIIAFVGRLMIALLFIGAGLNKFTDIPGTAAYIEAHGLPPMLAMPTAAFEVIGGILLLIGLFTRPLAILFAGFTLTTILFFHGKFSDPVQMAMAMKNVAIAIWTGSLSLP